MKYVTMRDGEMLRLPTRTRLAGFEVVQEVPMGDGEPVTVSSQDGIAAFEIVPVRTWDALRIASDEVAMLARREQTTCAAIADATGAPVVVDSTSDDAVAGYVAALHRDALRLLRIACADEAQPPPLLDACRRVGNELDLLRALERTVCGDDDDPDEVDDLDVRRAIEAVRAIAAGCPKNTTTTSNGKDGGYHGRDGSCARGAGRREGECGGRADVPHRRRAARAVQQ